MVDVFFAEYVNPGDNEDAVFGSDGVLDELQQWKSNGWIRYVGAARTIVPWHAAWQVTTVSTC